MKLNAWLSLLPCPREAAASEKLNVKPELASVGNVKNEFASLPCFSFDAVVACWSSLLSLSLACVLTASLKVKVKPWSAVESLFCSSSLNVEGKVKLCCSSVFVSDLDSG